MRDLRVVDLRTGRASSVESDLVTFEFEVFGNHRRQLADAALDIKHFAATSAVKVVVVADVCQFVARRITRQLNCFEPAFFDQCFNIAIDRGDPQRGGIDMGLFEHFLWRKRSGCASEGYANGATLIRFSFDHPVIIEAYANSITQ